MKPGPLISVVIRTHNEESWIRHSLESVFSQEDVSYEVIIVDHSSSDKTLEIAKKFPVKKIVKLDEYTPGRALNLGVENSDGDFVAFLSAHCIATSSLWLKTLLDGFETDDIVGVYGKQIPLAFSDPIDRNDLFMVFGEERRRQTKDWFFHNANSMIRKSAWVRDPFDELASNIEDRLWARTVLSNGFTLIYEPAAQVFHHNGLHRTSDAERVRKHVEIIEGVKESSNPLLPETLLPENSQVVAIVPVSQKNIETPNFDAFLSSLLEDIHSSRFISNVVILSPGGDIGDSSTIRLSRELLGISDSQPLDEVLSAAVQAFESVYDIPDFFLYLNWDYESRPAEFFDNLVSIGRLGGYDTVFGAEKDFSHYWVMNSSQREFREIDASLSSRDGREPVYRALYGLGTLVSAPLLRSGKLTGGRVGIHGIDSSQVPRRLRST